MWQQSLNNAYHMDNSETEQQSYKCISSSDGNNDVINKRRY